MLVTVPGFIPKWNHIKFTITPNGKKSLPSEPRLELTPQDLNGLKSLAHMWTKQVRIISLLNFNNFFVHQRNLKNTINYLLFQYIESIKFFLTVLSQTCQFIITFDGGQKYLTKFKIYWAWLKTLCINFKIQLSDWSDWKMDSRRYVLLTQLTFKKFLDGWGFKDFVQIPENIEPGAYVMSFRWDSQKTPQIWSNCANIEVV